MLRRKTVFAAIPEPCLLNSTDALSRFCHSRKTFWGSLPSQASHCSSQAEPEVLWAATALSFLQQLPSAAHGFAIGRGFVLFYFKLVLWLQSFWHAQIMFSSVSLASWEPAVHITESWVSKYHLGPRAQAWAATANVINTTLGVSN